MRCLVTGVAGFIGSHLAERLLADGHEVIGVDAFTDYYARSIKEKNLEGPRSWERFTFLEGDLCILDLVPLLSGVGWVFHLAAQAGVRGGLGGEFLEYIQHNIIATERLLATVCQISEVQRFVYASSSSVYGDDVPLPVKEHMLQRRKSIYAAAKLFGEDLCHIYASHHTFAVPTVVLRYFTVYGARQRPDMAFHKFFQAILNRQPVIIYGDGAQTRDFTHVSDIVEANVRAVTSPGAIGKILNIAGGSRTSLLEVTQLLGEITELPVEVQCVEKQAGDVLHTYADISLAAELIGYHPRVTLREGLANEFAWMKSLWDEK